MKLDLVAVFIIIVVLLPPLANVPDGYQLDGIPTILLELVCWPYLFHNLVINNVKSSLILLLLLTDTVCVDLASLLLFSFFILLDAFTSYFHLLIRYVNLSLIHI